jgi:hypothetical protein
MDWHENIGPGAIQSPTRSDTTGGQAGAAQSRNSGPGVDGGQIAPRSGGSGKGDIFYNARWQVVLNALYQLPGNFEVGTSLFGRQGYVYPVVLRLSAGGDGAIRTLAVPNIDEIRRALAGYQPTLAKQQERAASVALVLREDAERGGHGDGSVRRGRVWWHRRNP